MAVAFKNGSLFWTWIPRSDRRRVRVSTGTADKRTALAIDRMIGTLHERAHHDVLDAVADRDQTLLELYADYRDDSTVADTRAALDDVDLAPLVDIWHEALVRRSIASADAYRLQVRQLIPAGARYPRSLFRRKTISAFLIGLAHSGSTRNRYKAALRQFGAWLVEREVLEHNPVVDVKGSKENPSRIVLLSPEELRALLGALDHPSRALEALMVATGMDWSDTTRLKRRDVDLDAKTVRAHGSKRSWRNRSCAITELWVIPIIAGYIKDFTPNAPLFPNAHEKTFLDRHHAAGVDAKVPRSTLHDHRHSYSVNALRRGMPLQLVAHQLGHKDTTLVQRTYGKFVPQAFDFARWTDAAAPSAMPKKGRAARRVIGGSNRK
jgi:integrase